MADLFLMTLEERAILETHLGPDRRTTLGRIDEAAYLGFTDLTTWERVIGKNPVACFVPPFDATGADVHDLIDGSHVPLEGERDPLGSIRLARGTVVPLVPRVRGDEAPLRDGWGSHERLVWATHFGLTVIGAAPVAVAFARSPLVIGTPEPSTFEAVLGATDDETRATLVRSTAFAPSGEADVITIRVGDEVEVLGVVTTPEACRGRFDLMGRRAGYRDAPVQDVTRVLGDADGLRMVVRLVSRG